MKQAWKRIGRAVALGLAWAVAWIPVAVLIGTLIVDPDNSMDEMWAAVGAYPGFLCGALFCALLGADPRGRLENLSLPGAALRGAAAGIPVGVLPFVLGDAETGMAAWLFAALVVGSVTLMSTLSAVASAVGGRIARHRRARSAAA